MVVLNFIKDYWVLITCILIPCVVFMQNMIEATKCSLRNDILSIYDMCKDKQEITQYQFEALMHSAEIYFKLKGNSFVKEIVEKIKTFKIVD